MIASEKPSRETLNQWHNDPSNWELGIFYFNNETFTIRIGMPSTIKD